MYVLFCLWAKAKAASNKNDDDAGGSDGVGGCMGTLWCGDIMEWMRYLRWQMWHVCEDLCMYCDTLRLDFFIDGQIAQVDQQMLFK